MNILELTHKEQQWLDKLKYSKAFHVLCWGLFTCFLIYTYNKG